MRSKKSETKPALSWEFEAIGTAWEIALRRELDADTKQLIECEIEQFDAAFSRFRGDSLVTRLASKPGSILLPVGTERIFEFYEELYELTGGKVTPLIGGTVSDAGYDSRYSLSAKELLRTTPSLQSAMQRNGAELMLNEPALIDIGAAGKGYLIDRLAELLSDQGYVDALVDGSGDMRAIGDFNETVGLENPLETSEVIGSVQLNNASLCASASNRRAWGKWHHVIDPLTNTPVQGVIATWVIAESTMIADGLATALFFADPKELQTKYTYEYLRMHSDGSADYSDYFAKGVFS